MGMPNPQQVPARVYTGRNSTLCDVSGVYADLGRHASAEKGFLMEYDAEAVEGFLTGNVISRFL